MKRLLDFTGFLNESLYGSEIYYIFIPLDKNLKCVYSDLENSSTPLPSQRDNSGTAGYLLVPCTTETFYFGVNYLNRDFGSCEGKINRTKSPEKEGFLFMNSDVDFDPTAIGSTGVKSIGAGVPGYMKQDGIYLRSGDALALEFIMKRQSSFQVISVSSIDEKISNGFQKNTAIKLEYSDLEEAAGEIRDMLAAASDESFGLEIYISRRNRKKYSVTDDLLNLFEADKGKFMTFNFSQEKIDQIIDMAKETAESEDVIQTIENLTDLKDSGFFDD
jgi:hypothetical protein